MDLRSLTFSKLFLIPSSNSETLSILNMRKKCQKFRLSPDHAITYKYVFMARSVALADALSTQFWLFLDDSYRKYNTLITTRKERAPWFHEAFPGRFSLSGPIKGLKFISIGNRAGRKFAQKVDASRKLWSFGALFSTLSDVSVRT